MQASWGTENKYPKPIRGGEMYGEVGRYLQAGIESVPWYATRKEREAAKHPHIWDSGYSTEGSAVNQDQSTKRPKEMDIAPQGVKVMTKSQPGVMTMADHDHGTVWPPKKGHECDLAFQSMVKEKKADFHTEVNGIMIGYQGHVPRARDKVGSCPLGRVPGRPGAPSLSGDAGFKMSSQSVKRTAEPTLYQSEARDPQLAGTFKPGQRIHSSMDPNDTYKGGVPPGYAGHVHGARYSVGQTTFSTADTYGHPDSQGATAKQFSSHNDARGATYDDLADIYAGGFVADGLADDPRDSYIMDDGIAGNRGQKPVGASAEFVYTHG